MQETMMNEVKAAITARERKVELFFELTMWDSSDFQ